MITDTVHVFVGPTAYRYRHELPSFVRLHPPAERGDVALLLASECIATLAIVDGAFYDRLAVGHRELMAALEHGWEVWGLSSMGALRAVELANYGMRGFGEVFARALADPHFRDDELTLLHGPGPTYEPVTEALINLRALLEELVATNALTHLHVAELVASLECAWFGDRTLRSIEKALASDLETYRALITARNWDVKASDFRAFMDMLATRPR